MTSVIVFTGNAPRHLALVQNLASRRQYHHVIAVIEAGRLRPTREGALAPYWDRVRAAEAEVFGGLMHFGEPADYWNAGNVTALILGRGDASHVEELPHLVRDHDAACVFGSSWLRGPLCDALVAQRALNLHVGIAPEYRGSGCNFWAAYDGHPELVGSTVHYLAPDIDAGDIVGTVVAPDEPDVFLRGMLAVREGIDLLVRCLEESPATGTPQDSTRLIRDCKAGDFTEAVAAEALRRWTP